MAKLKKPVGLVFIHGAGKEPSTYYREFLAALTKELGQEPPYRAAWWSDVCNIGPVVRKAKSAKSEQFRQAFLQEMGVKAATRGSPSAGSRSVRSVGSTLFSLADVANDVVQYLFNEHLRHDVQARLIQDLDKARDLYASTILVSHSLGTVISYDVLRQQARAYNVRTWFTTGCPLSKLVKLRQCTTDIGQIALPPAERWENLYDTSDVVASALGKTFSCSIQDRRVKNGSGIMGSHDYWRNPVMAEIVAKTVKGG